MSPLHHRIAGGFAAAALFAILAFQTTDLSAQRVVELPASDTDLTVSFDEVYSIGGMSAAEWEAFGTPVTVGFGSDGLLRVLDGSNHRVLAVDQGGALAWESGGEGGGPGEFGYPLGMAVASDGTTTVYDVGHAAFVQFAPDGSYIDQTPHDRESGTPARDMVAHPDGGVVFSGAGAISVRRGPDGSATRVGADSGAPIRRSLAGAGDGVMYDAWRLPATEMEESTPSSGFQMRMPTMRAFEPGLFFGAVPSGQLAVVDTTDYTIKIVGNSGVELVLRRPLEPHEVGRSERDAEKKRRLDELEEGGGPRAVMITRGGPGGNRQSIQTPGQDQMREMLEGRIENMQFAESIPVIEGMRVDPWSGRIWIRRTGERIGEDGPIDVLSADGEYLGSLDADDRIPAAFGPDGWVAYLDVDEFDATTIEVGRLQGLP